MFSAPALTVIHTLSLHDALPIWLLQWTDHPCRGGSVRHGAWRAPGARRGKLPADRARDDPRGGPAPHRTARGFDGLSQDRKSTRLNSSHGYTSYAVFCLKKKSHL